MVDGAARLDWRHPPPGGEFADRVCAMACAVHAAGLEVAAAGSMWGPRHTTRLATQFRRWLADVGSDPDAYQRRLALCLAVDALTDTDPLDLILPAAKALHRC